MADRHSKELTYVKVYHYINELYMYISYFNIYFTLYKLVVLDVSVTLSGSIGGTVLDTSGAALLAVFPVAALSLLDSTMMMISRQHITALDIFSHIVLRIYY